VKKRKTVRARRKRKEMIKNFVNFLLSPNLVISYYIYQIRHLIIISALEIKQEEIDCVSSKKNPIQRAKCQTNPYQKRPNIRYKAKKKIQSKRWCFLSNNKTKNESFLPPLKTDEKKLKFPLKKSNEKLFALFCSCEFVLVINLSRQKKTKKHPKVT